MKETFMTSTCLSGRLLVYMTGGLVLLLAELDENTWQHEDNIKTDYREVICNMMSI